MTDARNIGTGLESKLVMVSWRPVVHDKEGKKRVEGGLAWENVATAPGSFAPAGQLSLFHCAKRKKHECPQPAGPAPSQQRPVSSAWIGATTLPRRHRPRRHRSASLCMQRSAFLLCTSTCRARRGGRSWQQSMQEQDDWILSSNRSLIALATSRGEMHLVSWRSWQLQLLS